MFNNKGLNIIYLHQSTAFINTVSHPMYSDDEYDNVKL